MKWLRLIIEIILWVIAFAAIIRGMKSTDGLMFGYGLFILWAWLFFSHIELRARIK